MNEQAHRDRHAELLRALDELAADYMGETGKLVSQTTVMELMQWSNEQVQNAPAIASEKEKMMRAADEKYGPGWEMKALSDDGDLMVFDRCEVRPAKRDEVVDMQVVLDGKLLGPTKVVGTLDADVIERNMGWMPAMQCGRHRVDMATMAKIEVDKDAGVVRLTSKPALEKEVCQGCINKVADEFEDRDGWNSGERDGDELRWKRGNVLCPIFEEFVTESHMRPITEGAPSWCPYKERHQ